MGNGGIEKILADMNPSAKKELLNGLLNSLQNDLSEAEKKGLLQTLLTGRKENRQLVDMVEH